MEVHPPVAPDRYGTASAPTASGGMPWQIVGAVFLCMAIIVALDISYLIMSSNQIAARDRLERTIAAGHSLDRLQALLVDAETAARGYALVGREVMLEPYHNARARYAEALAEVATLIGDDPVQQSSLEILRGLVDDKWAILLSTIESVNRSGPTRSTATEATTDAPGKVVMDAIRNQIGAMHARESAIRDQLSIEFQRAVVYTRTTVLFASLLALFAISALYWATRRYFRLRLEAETDLRTSEERYKILTEVSPQIIWMADVQGKMTYCNRQWIDYSGLSLEQSIAAGASSVVSEKDRVEVGAAWRRAIQRDEAFEAEVRLRRGSDGAYRWHLARAQPVRDSAGNTTAWLGVALDIDDRKMIELALDEFRIALAEQVAERTASLQERTAQLKALNQNLIRVAENERSRLARELHDELGAHLSVAMMDLTIISRRLSETELTDIAALVRRLAETLGATTQISRRIISDLRPVMIRELGLAGALDAYCASFEQTTGIRCARIFPEQLEPMIEEAGIAVFRIVQESLSNIVKYAGASEVRLDLRVAGGFVELSIKDDGKGMPEGARTRKGSHGLLGISERAEAFGGALRMSDGLHGRGTGIVVTLALAQIAISDSHSAAPPSLAAALPESQVERRH